MAPPPPSSSALSSATKKSTLQWRSDLKTLFEHAKERFPDVVWKLAEEGEGSGAGVDEVWGHKAIVYARAPPSFQSRYFSFRPAPITTPTPYGPSQSSYSLTLPSHDYPSDNHGSRSPSPFNHPRASSPAPSTNTVAPLLRLSTNISPALFSNELEYLYTGSGLSDAFEFLFDDAEKRPEGDEEENRVDKLRKDLVYMWRSRLYSDIRISLTGAFSSTSASADDGEATAVFSSHRFVLVSRSSYFRTLLLSQSFAPIPTASTGLPFTITLPHPPFTPASLHFTLGYIYTGTLSFSHRTFDLTTAFHIFRSAMYLSLNALISEIEARIVEDMVHGLFHAYLPFEQYEKVTAGRWGVGGCKCKTCQRRVPRVLAFAIADDVQNAILTRGAQRALAGMYGEGWCSADFAALPHKIRHNLLKGVQLRTTPANVIPLLFATHAALSRLDSVEAKGDKSDGWVESIREMVNIERRKIDEVMCVSCEEVFEQEEWIQILERDGAEFGDAERVEWVMNSVRRGVSDETAGLVYQTIVSAILIRTHPSSGIASTILPSHSVIRATVERARVDLIHWIGRQNRWQMIHHAGGFELMESWAIKEISDEIEVSLETLVAPRHGAGKRDHTTATRKATYESEGASMSSVHTNVTNPQRANTSPKDGPVAASSGSVRSALTNHSRFTSTTTPSRNPTGLSASGSPPPALLSSGRAIPAARLQPILSSREPSMAPPDDPDDASSTHSLSKPANPSRSPRSPLPTSRTSPSQPSTTPTPPNGRPKSLAPSVASVRSKASTIRKASPSTTASRVSSTQPPVPTSTRSSSGRRNAGPQPTGPTTTPARTSSTLLPPEDTTIPQKISKEHTAAIKSRRSQLSPPSGLLEPEGVTSAINQRKRSISASSSNTTSKRNLAGTFHAADPSSIVDKSPQSRPRRTSIASTSSATVQETTKRPRSSARSPDNSQKSPAPRHSRHALDSDKVSPTPPSMALSVRNVEHNTGALSIKRTSSVASTTSTASAAASEMRRVGPAVAAATAALMGRNRSLPDANTEQMPRAPDSRRRKVQPATPVDETPSYGLGLDLKGNAEQKLNDLGSEEDDDGQLALAHRDSQLPSHPPKVKISEERSWVSKPPRTHSANKSDGASTVKGAVDLGEDDFNRRRDSSDTITATNLSGHQLKRTTPSIAPQRALKGITLNVGIPCIISSKRTRFKAFARYIGEVEGELGPWIGVEVPLSEGSKPEKLVGREWNDGSRAGVKYFDIASTSVGPGWDTEDQRAARRRRVDMLLANKGTIPRSTFGGRKRDGDHLTLDGERLKRLRSVSPAMSDMSVTTEVRGLFVRPQQVLYVVGAEP